jgi:pimeloyl-ACP methyl ester carboxylesterase
MFACMLRRLVALAAVALLLGPLAFNSAEAQAPRARADTWRDPTAHRVRFVTVAPDVRLHTLDFGGTGPTLLFLAGLGNTAHAWDNFAPRFIDRNRVIAITRRGFGESSHPDDGYDLDTLVNDIRAVLDTLAIDRVTLVGHSIAAEELTRFAITYPNRVSKLVYLDGAYDRPTMLDLVDSTFTEPVDIPSMPQPTARDTATPAAYVTFVHRTRGVDIPEADIRARLRYDGSDETATLAYQSVGSAAEAPRWDEISAPALAVYSVVDSVDQAEPWVRADRARRGNQQAFLDKINPIYAYSRDKFRRDMKRGTVLEIRGGHHWVFLSHAERVARAMRDFLQTP